MQFLRRQGIPFQVLEYEHLAKGAAFASQALSIPVEKTIKTLITEITPTGYLVLLMPGHRTVSFKKLAQARGVKKAGMVSPSMAERLTGYMVGGISPFGMKRRLPVLIEASLLEFDKVAINGGRRGVMLVMAPQDILKALGAEPIDM
jgi:Cys-tRNA(Pro)/Cys-tRNA(Cys) deacylase